MARDGENVVAAVFSLRVFIVPLCAAAAAALFAHLAIDLAGDYLLPYDTYDDVAHGSRWIVFAIVACGLGLLAVAGSGAAIREARGSVDELGRALRASLALGWKPSFALTLGCATAILAAMGALDAHVAGGATSDVADLFGGSLALGLASLVASALVCATGMRALVRAVAGVRRSLVHALAIVFATRRVARSLVLSDRPRARRALAESRMFGTSLSGRAPPLRARFRPL